MTETPKSIFRFTGFFVRESHIVFKGNEQDDVELEIHIQPSGILYRNLGQFELRLDVQVKSQSDMLDVQVCTAAFFDFDESVDMPLMPNNKFFTQNAPAIVFPYIRAYIGTLTAQSGAGVILLPALNLSGLEADLSKNIEVKV